mmetsp:Transcript_101513/g.322574  ORF Transcript_101513/g.322574 Transcript_101513/m.322574 type:complete len:394 (+) Transcript_101513:349-1530(+)
MAMADSRPEEPAALGPKEQRDLLSDEAAQDLLHHAAWRARRRRRVREADGRALRVALVPLAPAALVARRALELRAPRLPLGPLPGERARLVAPLALATLGMAGHVLRRRLELLHGRGHRLGAGHVAGHVLEGAPCLLGLARLVVGPLRVERRALLLDGSPLPLRAGVVAGALVAAAVVAAVHLLLRGQRLRGRRQEVHGVVGHVPDQAPRLREQQLLGVGVEPARRVVAAPPVALDRLRQLAARRRLATEGARAGFVAGPVLAARLVADHRLAEPQQLLDRCGLGLGALQVAPEVAVLAGRVARLRLRHGLVEQLALLADALERANVALLLGGQVPLEDAVDQLLRRAGGPPPGRKRRPRPRGARRAFVLRLRGAGVRAGGPCELKAPEPKMA